MLSELVWIFTNVTCVLEVDLATPTTASDCVRCARQARWPQRRPSMTPNVYVTPRSISRTQRPAKWRKSRVAKKVTTSGPNVFLIKKHFYMVSSPYSGTSNVVPRTGVTLCVIFDMATLLCVIFYSKLLGSLKILKINESSSSEMYFVFYRSKKIAFKKKLEILQKFR